MMLVRIYLSESQARLDTLLPMLFESQEIAGLTIFRGEAGFGQTVVLDPTRLAEPDNPPVVLEFFESKNVAEEQAARICRLVGARHVVMWPVDVYSPDPRASRRLHRT